MDNILQKTELPNTILARMSNLYFTVDSICFMNEPRRSRREILAKTGTTLAGSAVIGLAGCLGAAENPEAETTTTAKEILNQSTEELEAPSADGSDLAGTAGGGNPDWVDATSMDFDGWYYADEYDPAMPYARENITFSLVNNAGYSVDVISRDASGEVLYNDRVNFANGYWFRNNDTKEIEITVLGSAQGEQVVLDMENGSGHEIWLSGAVLTASYWVGRW